MNNPYPGMLPLFDHQNSHILGIGGHSFLDLSEYCIFDLEKMHDEICLAMAKNHSDQLPAVSGKLPEDLHVGDFHNKFFENEYMMKYSSGDIVKNVKDLTVNQRRKYLFFKNKTIQPWSFILTLKPNKFHNKTADVLPWKEFVDIDLPYTKKCIENLPLKQIGRVVIYASYPNNAVPPHRDGPIQPHKDHHININPGGYRPVYVYDSIEKKKYYLDKKIRMYAFNVRDYHGVEPLSYFSYTLRIDGEYQEQILNKFNISPIIS